MSQSSNTTEKTQEKESQSSQKRAKLLKALENVKGIKLDSTKRMLFIVEANQTSGKVLVQLTASNTEAKIGKDTPVFDKMPTHGLEAIYRGLKSRELVDTTNGDVELRAPKQQVIRAEDAPDKEPLRGIEAIEYKKIVDFLNVEPGTGKNSGNQISNIELNVNSTVEKAKSGDSKAILRLKRMLAIEKDNYNRHEVVEILRTSLIKLGQSPDW